VKSDSFSRFELRNIFIFSVDAAQIKDKIADFNASGHRHRQGAGADPACACANFSISVVQGLCCTLELRDRTRDNDSLKRSTSAAEKWRKQHWSSSWTHYAMAVRVSA